MTESDASAPSASDPSSDATAVSVGPPESSASDDGASLPTLPDPTSISARLKNLVVSVSQVEELSRRAREVAASDLALYDGIAASRCQFEEGLDEARRIGQEAKAVYQRAFGRDAKALAEPAVAEARDVQQAFGDLAGAWRQQAETFLAEHPDVEALIAEQRHHDDEVRRREVARAKAERFQQLVVATDAALRQGLLDDARDCIKLLGREFPAEAARIAPLQERLDHRMRAANDAAAGNKRGCIRALVGGVQSARPERRPRTPPLLYHPRPRHHPASRPERALRAGRFLCSGHGPDLLRGADRKRCRSGRCRDNRAGTTVSGG